MEKVRIAAFFPGKNPDFSFLDLIEVEKGGGNKPLGRDCRRKGAGEKHTTINRSGEDFRYIEFFTHPPLGADFVEVK